MTPYKIAHIEEKGVNIIIIPLESSFGNKTKKQQDQIIDALQNCAKSAGLAGTVVPVWETGINHRFIAPPRWHPFFKTLSWDAILGKINKELNCE
jgi:hypothetical protein